MPEKKWIPRTACAQILETSPSNVRRMQREGTLSWKRDRNGTVLSDRTEVEALARKRLGRVKPSGELAARIFRLIKAGKCFEDVVIETEQDPDTVEQLFERYAKGARLGATPAQESATLERKEREQRAHDEQIRAMEEELARQRVRAHGVPAEDDEWPTLPPKSSPSLAKAKRAPDRDEEAEDEEADQDGEGSTLPARRPRRASGGR